MHAASQNVTLIVGYRSKTPKETPVVESTLGETSTKFSRKGGNGIQSGHSYMEMFIISDVKPA